MTELVRTLRPHAIPRHCPIDRDRGCAVSSGSRQWEAPQRTAAPRPRSSRLAYVIAAYSLVIGSIVVYGLWLQAQRRAVARDEASLAAGRAETRLPSDANGTTPP